MKRLLTTITLLLTVLLTLSAYASDYAYSTLSKSDKALYNRLGEAILHTEATVKDVKEKKDDALKVFSAYLNDHPGIFWVDNGFRYITERSADGRTSSSIALSYTHQENLKKDQQTFVEMVKKFHSYLEKDPNDYVKLYHIYDYLASSIRYDNAYMDQSMWSVFFNGVGVCAGFARSFQYLALQEGIPCIIVLGYERNEKGKKSEVGHAWCMAKVDGKWYHFDPTWGLADKDGNTDFTYFCRSTERMELTHIISSPYPLPSAKDDRLSMINVRHRSLKKYSKEAMREIVKAALEKKEYTFTVEFGSKKELEKAEKELFKKDGISTILRDTKEKWKSVSYVTNKQAYSLKLILNQ